MTTTPGHFSDLDCMKAGGLDDDGNCSICGASGGDLCIVCGDSRFHRPNCPQSDRAPNLGGCGSCVLGLCMMNGEEIQACDDCARAGTGFANQELASDDSFAAGFAYHAVTLVAQLRGILWPDQTLSVRPVGEATVERISDLLAAFKPRTSEQGGV